MNLKNLLKLREIEKGHALDMAVFYKHGESAHDGWNVDAAATPWEELRKDLLSNKCGTAGCHAGWACLLQKPKEDPRKQEDPSSFWRPGVIVKATRILGFKYLKYSLKYRQEDFLFAGRSHFINSRSCTEKEAKLRLQICIEAARRKDKGVNLTFNDLRTRLEKRMPK